MARSDHMYIYRQKRCIVLTSVKVNMLVLGVNLVSWWNLKSPFCFTLAFLIDQGQACSLSADLFVIVGNLLVSC